MTSKLQLTVPKAIADQYGIKPGDELLWTAAGEAIRVILAGKKNAAQGERPVRQRLELFDQATQRLRLRRRRAGKLSTRPATHGWKREDLYDRGLVD